MVLHFFIDQFVMLSGYCNTGFIRWVKVIIESLVYFFVTEINTNNVLHCKLIQDLKWTFDKEMVTKKEGKSTARYILIINAGCFNSKHNYKVELKFW